MARLSALFLLVFGGFVTLFGVLGVVAAFAVRGGKALPLAVAIGVAVVGLLLVRWAVRIMRRTTPLGGATPAGGAAGAYSGDSSDTFELDGSPWTVAYTTPIRGKNGRPSKLVIHTPADCTHEFHITGETGFDRLAKNIGLAVEVQTGDPDFDGVCYVRTDTPAFTEAYLTDPIKRVAVVDLRRLGFPEVRLAKGRVEANWTGFDAEKHDRPDLTADAAARLVLLARNLPAPQPEFDLRTGGWRRTWQYILWPALLLFALTIFALIPFTPLAFGQIVWRAAGPLLLGVPAFGVVAATLLRGSSRSHGAWGALMIGALLMFPPGAIGTTALVNGVTDTSPPVVHDAPIVRKYTTKSKDSTNYHVECPSWRVPGETDSFGVSHSEYGRVVVGRSKLRATTRAGGLGVEWLVSKEVR